MLNTRTTTDSGLSPSPWERVVVLSHPREFRLAQDALCDAKVCKSDNKAGFTDRAYNEILNLFDRAPDLALNLAFDNRHADSIVREKCLQAFFEMAANEDNTASTFERVTQIAAYQSDSFPKDSALLSLMKRAFLISGDREMAAAQNDPAKKEALLDTAALALMVPTLNFDVAAFMTRHGRPTEPADIALPKATAPGKRPDHYGAGAN